MKIKATTIYVPAFIIVLLLQLYIPSFKLNIALQLAVLAVVFIIDQLSFSKAYLKNLFPFVTILLVGFAGTLLHKYQTYNIVKDIVHFIKPLTGFLIGYIFFKRINDFRVFSKTLVGASIISAFIHFFIILVLVRFRAGSIHEIREFTRDNFMELFGLLFLLFYKRFYGYSLIKNKLFHFSAIAILLVSFALYFSRTMIVAAIILVIAILGYTKITFKSLKVIGVVMVLIGLGYAYLYSVPIRRNKPGLEAFLYKIKIAPAEMFETNINRDNHADLWDHWRGYEAKRAYSLMLQSPSSFVFGTGHGSLVDLKFFAPLTGEKKGIRFISELHNGYMYVLYKTGFIGLLIYLFVLFKWYWCVYRFGTRNLPAVLISGIAVVYIFTTLTITGMYNNKDIFIMIMGALLYYVHTEKNITPVDKIGE